MTFHPNVRFIPLLRMGVERKTGRLVERESRRILAIPGPAPTYAVLSTGVDTDTLVRVMRNRRLDYRFRTSLGFSPLGLFDLRPKPRDGRWLSPDGTLLVDRPGLSKRGAYQVKARQIRIEEASLYPVVLGRHLKPFQAPWTDHRCVPLPWDGASPRLLSATGLASRPEHEAYLLEHRSAISRETQRADQRLVAESWFHPTRFGPYQLHPWKVLVRTNTRWCAAVAGSLDMPWAHEAPGGARRMIVPGLKASFISEQRRGSRGVGPAIHEEEAHYIAAVLNAAPHAILVEATNSQRSYSLASPPLYLPLYDPADPLHRDLAALGRAAARGNVQADEINSLFLRLLPP